MTTNQSNINDKTAHTLLCTYLQNLVSSFSKTIFQQVQRNMDGKSSKYLTDKMFETARMEQYMRQFKTNMRDLDYVNNLIDTGNPKFSHSIEMIYQWCVYDVYDQIENHLHSDGTKKKIDIQIELFSVFVRTFLTDIHTQLTTSKPFYFHNLSHQEQRQRVNAIVAPLLSRMVHPTKAVAAAAVSTTSAVVSSKIASSIKAQAPVSEGASRVVHVDESQTLADTFEEDDVEDVDETQVASTPSIASSSVRSSVRSSAFQSAVILPEPIRSAKPLERSETVSRPATQEPKSSKKTELKDLTITILPKPKTPLPIMSIKKIVSTKAELKVEPTKTEALKQEKVETKVEAPKEAPRPVVVSVKKHMITPMKIQSDAIHQRAAKVQSVSRKIQSVKAT